MQIIPNLIQPENDELLISYLYRICLLNSEHGSSYEWFFHTSGSDFWLSLCNLAAQIDKDPYELFMDTTLFSNLQITMTDEELIETADDIFNVNKDSSKDMWFLLTPEKNTIYYCRDCAREDLDRKGFKYIHRSHQITAGFCLKHHRKTETAQPTRFLNANNDQFPKRKLPGIHEYETGFTHLFLKYATDITEKRLITSYTDIMSHVEKAFVPSVLLPSGTFYEAMQKEDLLVAPGVKYAVQDSLMNNVFASYIAGKEKGFSLQGYPRFVLALLAYTGTDRMPYKSVDELLPYYKENKQDRWYRLVMNCSKAGYELLSKSEQPLMLVKKFGTEIIRTVSIFAIITGKLV